MSRNDLTTLASKYPIDESSWNQILLWAPSRHYIPWVVKRTHKGEDLSKLLEAVAHFHNNKTRLPSDKRDLLRYRTLSSLRKQLDKIGVQSNRQRRKKRARGYLLLDEIGDVKFYLIENYEGARTLSLGTKWCIANEGDFKSHYSRSVIVVAVIKGKRERDRFSKFAIVLDDREPGYPWTSNSLPSWKEIRNYHLLDKWKGSSRRYTIFDELNDEVFHHHPGNTAFEEILDMRSGRQAVVQEVIAKAIKQHRKPKELVETTFAELRKGRSLRHQQFMHLADVVVENELFNVISLFEHPKARARTCREYLWSLVNPETLGQEEARFLAQTSAMAIPEAVDAVGRVMVGVYRRQNRRNSIQTLSQTTRQNLLTLILSNKHLTEETKSIIYEFIGRDVLKMKALSLK